jgi:hypothetical protein
MRVLARAGRRLGILLAGVVAVSSGCNTGADRVLEVEATGVLAGRVFVDRNGNLTQDAGEGPVPGVAVRIVPAGGRTAVHRVVSTLTGSLVVNDLPVGEYELVVESATVPDSLRLIHVASDNAPLAVPVVRLTVTDTAEVQVVLSFPTVKVREARLLAPGMRVFVEAVALNAWTTFGDSTLHVADSTGAIRATRVAQSSVSAGQIARLLGSTDLRDGQATLTDVTVFPLATGQLPSPVSATTAVAAGADQGRLDAALVQVTGTVLSAQPNPAGDVLLAVTDGSGLLEVVLDRSTGITSSSYIPGSALAVTGLLAPSGQPGRWQLKPRSAADLVVTVPLTTIAEARRLEPGRVVQIEGIALNAWAAFADSTVHMSDATGTIRAVRVQPTTIFAGDRVRMQGTIVFRDGQPTLSNVTASVLGPDVLPLAERLTTARASSADGGRLDAALVRVIDALVGDTATVGGDFRLVVDDGSGPLEVLIDRDAGFQLGIVPGAILDVGGVLVPVTGGAAWRLKPRAPSDLLQVGNARATIAEARALPLGRVVVIEGVALNGWVTFADSTVHVADDTGFIRAVQVRPANIAAGSRVRLLGTVGVRDGQPVLANVTPSVIGSGILPLAPALSTATASTADGGRLDAALVRVLGARVVDVSAEADGFVVRVNDGSGALEVLLDRDVGFQPGQYTANRVLNITGVLVPTSGGSGWRLKPRQTSDVVIVQ